MFFLESALLIVYFAILIVLAIFGFHRYRMVYLYFRNRNCQFNELPKLEKLPRVTIQLPIYNEIYVVERLIDSICQLDYPRSLLEIQVLDDSSDETIVVARNRVARQRSKGMDIHHIRRNKRTGFKAGALAAGLELAHGDLVAIFDADFVPDANFLQRVVPYFSDPEIGMVQARWGHINRDYSLLTRVQSVLLDAHFVLEHGGRHRADCFFNFNGTAGVWRRTAIEEAGGWQHDTLTEDMDLSYRAQLKSWRFQFLPEVVAPAELPVAMNSFKTQQHRWTKGSIQTARKLLPRILASPLPFRVRVEALFHLTANLTYPLMIVLSLLMFPSMLIRFNMGAREILLIDLPFFLAATTSVTSFYIIAQMEVYPDWKRRIKVLPMLISLGIGMCLNNGCAAIEALAGRKTGFVRTPKYQIESGADSWWSKKYRGKVSLLPLIEVCLGLYFTFTVVYATYYQIWGTLPFLVLFQVGFFYTGFLSLSESFPLWRRGLLSADSSQHTQETSSARQLA